MNPFEDALLVYLNFPPNKLQDEKALDALFDLDNIFEEVAYTTNAGYYDGHEFCEGPEEESITFFLYGQDIQRLYQVLLPLLQALPKLPGSYILKRYRKKTPSEEKILLSYL